MEHPIVLTPWQKEQLEGCRGLFNAEMGMGKSMVAAILVIEQAIKYGRANVIDISEALRPGYRQNGPTKEHFLTCIWKLMMNNYPSIKWEFSKTENLIRVFK